MLHSLEWFTLVSWQGLTVEGIRINPYLLVAIHKHLNRFNITHE